MKMIFTISAILFASQTSASECEMRSPEAISEAAEIAFVGKVTSIRESSYRPREACWTQSKEAPQCGGKLVTLQVTERLRGELSSSATVVSEDACYCLGSYWKEGSSYLIVAKPNNTDLPGQVVALNGCNGTGEVDKRIQPIVKALRSSKS